MSIISEEGLRPRLREAIRKADEVVSKLESARQQAELHDSPGCAELVQALETAKSLRADFPTRDLNEAKWKRITWTLEFLLKMAQQFCSFVNCMFPREIHYEYWVSHKAFA